MNSENVNFDEELASAKKTHQSGALKEAISVYQKLTYTFPNQPEPFHMLALIASQDGQYEKANQLYTRAVQLNPQNVLYKNNFAEALQRMGREKEAIQLLNEALKIDPSFYLGKHKLASILKKLKNYEPAAQIFEEVIQQKPDYHQAYLQLGTLKLETGFYKAALELLKTAYDQNPDSIMTMNNLAVTHQELDEFGEAIFYYKKALEIDSNYQDALRNLALIYEKIGFYKEAKEYFLKQATVKNDPLIFWNAELVSPKIYFSKDEIKNYRERVSKELEKIKSRKFKVDVEELIKIDVHPPSDLLYHGTDDLTIKTTYADLFKSIPKLQLSNDKNEKPRVGFVVTTGHEGVFLKCMLGLINKLSTEKMNVFVICGFPNGHKIIQPKVTNPEVKILSLPKSLGNSVKQLVSMNFDFLHYWEIGTDAYNYFLPFFKPAKIQCTSWGWPVTSGNPNVDFFISSKGLDDEENQAHYSEKLILFKKLPVYYSRPTLPVFNQAKGDFGISERANLYLCTQNLRKIHPDFDEILQEILKKDEKAEIAILGDKYPEFDRILERRFDRSVDFGRDRLKIITRQDEYGYFNIIKLAEVILDTTHYTGGANTNYDAFAVGAPVVTLPSKYHRGKYTAAAYRQMDICDLIAESSEEYVALAVRVAKDKNFRKSIVSSIKEKSNKLFEDMEAVQELENFILEMT